MELDVKDVLLKLTIFAQQILILVHPVLFHHLFVGIILSRQENNVIMEIRLAV